MKYVYYILAFIIVGAVAGFCIWYALRPVSLALEGETVARQIQISPRIVGKVAELYVEEGQNVTKGDLLAKLDAPSIDAKAYQAEAALKAADAQKNKVFAGARPEEITALLNVYEKAAAAEKLYRKTYERIENLYLDGVVPAQQRDEAYTKWRTSVNDMAAAKAQYEMARSGARKEDKNAAVALTEEASGAVREVMSYVDDTMLTAPLNAEVSNVVVDTGELVTPGFPVITLTDMTDIWVAFNIREDLLKDIRMGSVLNVMFPAVSDSEYFPLEVRYISKLGDFAVWSATKTTGQFDLRTFEVKAYPLKPVPGLRSGMSAVFYMKRGDKSR